MRACRFFRRVDVVFVLLVGREAPPRIRGWEVKVCECAANPIRVPRAAVSGRHTGSSVTFERPPKIANVQESVRRARVQISARGKYWEPYESEHTLSQRESMTP